ncbi:MAG: hypothetical protein H0W86_00630 [Armatimonadetes bacterium]|nr:hypothetical protein [Armatimonadota bacterium]
MVTGLVFKVMKFLTPAIALVTIVTGCASSYTGKYKAMADMGVAKVSMGSLDLRGDKTFSLEVAMVSMEGTWSASGDTLTLTPNSSGSVKAKPFELHAKDGGKALTAPDQFKGAKFVKE